jgi:hypothetical protein
MVDISENEVSNSYFDLALEDWSEPLGDLITFCGTTRLHPGSSGNPNFTPLKLIGSTACRSECLVVSCSRRLYALHLARNWSWSLPFLSNEKY